MRAQSGVRLADLTTLRLGGPARRLVTAGSDDELIEAVRACDAAAEPLLVLGGGSNLVVADDGFPGTVVQVATTGVDLDGTTLTAAAGTDWDELVALAVSHGLHGIEALSGIPGTVGAAPIQNVGAYGQEVAQTVSRVRALDRHTGAVVDLDNVACDFTYRHSAFKGTDRWVVLSVTFVLRREASPVGYAELARRLGVETGATAPAERIRDAVLELRRGKGMVLDPDDHDTWSAGSFFTNPVLRGDEAARLLPDDAPRWPQPDGAVKTSAAWLIERAGFTRGHGTGRVRLSTKHTLALTNRGGATTAELVALAREVRDGVRDRFGITLVNEPVLVGVSI